MCVYVNFEINNRPGYYSKKYGTRMLVPTPHIIQSPRLLGNTRPHTYYIQYLYPFNYSIGDIFRLKCNNRNYNTMC